MAMCEDCGMKEAVTRDKRFCKDCLRSRIRRESPDVKCALHEEWDRPQLSWDALGGTEEMIDFEEAFWK